MTTKANAINDMVQTLAKGLKAAKTAEKKPMKAKLILSAEKQIEIARQAGEAAFTMLNAKEVFTAAAKQLHEVGAKIGDARKCKLAQAFLAGRYPDGKTKDGKPAAAQTKKNALAAFRAAVEKGSGYNENAKRDEKKAASKKGASHGAKTKAAAEDATIVCAIKRKATIKQAASEIRKLAEQMRSIEGLNLLAAMLVDVVNQIDNES